MNDRHNESFPLNMTPEQADKLFYLATNWTKDEIKNKLDQIEQEIITLEQEYGFDSEKLVTYYDKINSTVFHRWASLVRQRDRAKQFL